MAAHKTQQHRQKPKIDKSSFTTRVGSSKTQRYSASTSGYTSVKNNNNIRSWLCGGRDQLKIMPIFLHACDNLIPKITYPLGDVYPSSLVFPEMGSNKAHRGQGATPFPSQRALRVEGHRRLRPCSGGVIYENQTPWISRGWHINLHPALRRGLLTRRQQEILAENKTIKQSYYAYVLYACRAGRLQAHHDDYEYDDRDDDKHDDDHAALPFSNLLRGVDGVRDVRVSILDVIRRRFHLGTVWSQKRTRE